MKKKSDKLSHYETNLGQLTADSEKTPSKHDQLFLKSKSTQKFSPTSRQILAAFAPILATIAAGFTTGYSAIFLPQLQSKSSSIQISMEDGSWIASIAAFGMAPGCLLGGFVMEKYGRKFAIYTLGVPTIIGWLAIFFADNISMILVGRFLTGLATGFLGPPGSVYIGETSSPKNRGFLLASITLSISFGILLCHVLGTFLHWRLIAFIGAIFPVFIVIILWLVPESPCWLLTQQRYKEAEQSFLWLRGHSPESLVELENLVLKQKHESKINDETDNFAKLQQNVRKPEFYKPLAIILVFFFVMQFSGVNSVAFYTVSLMKNITGAGMEYFSMILIDIVRFFASLVACVLLKCCYRRTLVLVSGIGTSICLISVSFFMYIAKTNPERSYPIFSMAFLIGYICFISFGIFPLPWVLQGEMLQQVTRGFSSGLTSSFNFVCFFIVVKSFVAMSAALDTYGVFMCYGCVPLIGAIVLYKVMPETRNKTLQQIEEEFQRQ